MIQLANSYDEVAVSALESSQLALLLEFAEHTKLEPEWTQAGETYYWRKVLEPHDLPNEIQDIFGGSSQCFGECKLDRLGSNSEAARYHLCDSRIPGVSARQHSQLEQKWATLLWHADTYMDYDARKVIVYLTDTDETTGALAVEKNHRWAQDDDYRGVCEHYEYVDEIEPAYYGGPAGTVISFSTRLLHRINVPQSSSRLAFHILVK